MELDTIPQPALEQMEQYQGADLVVGVLGARANGQRAGAPYSRSDWNRRRARTIAACTPHP